MTSYAARRVLRNILASCIGRLLAAAWLLAGPSGTGRALTIKKAAGEAGVETILLEGKFEEGDALALKGYVAKLPAATRVVVHLNSTGGSVREALATGRVIHKNRTRTVVPSKANCNSSCVAAFLGGRDWETGRPWQLKYSSARLGVHSFRRDYTDKEYTGADMSKAVADTLKMVLSFAEYWDEIGADYEFLYLQWSASNKDPIYIHNERLLDLGIKVLDECSGEIIEAKPVKDRTGR